MASKAMTAQEIADFFGGLLGRARDEIKKRKQRTENADQLESEESNGRTLRDEIDEIGMVRKRRG